MNIFTVATVYIVANIYLVTSVQAVLSLSLTEVNLDKRDGPGDCYNAADCDVDASRTSIPWNQQVSCVSVQLGGSATLCPNCYSRDGCTNIADPQCLGLTSGCFHPF